MLDEDLIKPIREIFEIGNQTQFIIPSYQRGYKWNRQNVTKLLDDLLTFQDAHKTDTEDNSFYCLQNITLVPSKDKKTLHVVDGQQRLTTIFILLSYLRKNNMECELLDFFKTAKCLKYDVRVETAYYLENEIFSGNIWDNKIFPEKQDRKDKYYIADVAEGVKQWFDTKKNSQLSIHTITDRLKLIVNKMNSNDVAEEEIFAGLNGGKVDLDGADLVRAELITRSSKEKFENHKSSDSAKVREFRQRIAMELDTMNQWWSDKDRITYFEQFLQNNFCTKTIFNHKSHPIGLLYKLYFEVFHKDKETFGIEFFENGRDLNEKPGDDHWEFYASVMELNNTLEMWYNDSMLYHWIGYLIFGYKKSVSFREIWEMWNQSITKEDFLKKVLSKIIDRLATLGKGNIAELISDIQNTNIQWYGSRDNDITHILVLMDILKCTGFYVDCWNEKQKEQLEKKDQNKTSLLSIRPTSLRLPSNYFQKFNEDYEHVRSCAPNGDEGKKELNKKVWIEHIASTYQDVEKETEEWKMKEAILERLNTYEGEMLDDHMITIINEEMNKCGQHSIGNTVLLDSGVNRSYKNASFQVKIQRIFYEFLQGTKYIRPYTMMVFEHKISDSDKSWRWTRANINENVTNISYNVKRFIDIAK